MRLAKFFLILLCLLFLVIEAVAVFANILIMFNKPSFKTFIIICIGVGFLIVGIKWLVAIFRGAA